MNPLSRFYELWLIRKAILNRYKSFLSSIRSSAGLLSVPYLLILIRFLFAPTIVLLALFSEFANVYIIVLMTVGLLTDIFDGIIARHQHCSTEKMRRMDSQTDLIFWLSIGFSAWWLQSDILSAYLPSILALFFLEFLCYFISITKFKRETCTHAYLSKFFGLTMFVAFFNLIGFGNGGKTLEFAIAAGIVSHLDRLFITFLLPHWTFDVPSFYHAYLLRKGRSFKKHKLFH
jgi:phosphatidylglycerophosphate synthase